ncbi:MAG: peptidylprolyl isomerase [Fimbriimonadaceae bacterium]|nr:peptidylprolyl isomerase [Chthonomonadaceae bacterium]MCO5296563.1 peptidylprolyl isomerase [Fimbriimonadaceae bacterium]
MRKISVALAVALGMLVVGCEEGAGTATTLEKSPEATAPAVQTPAPDESSQDEQAAKPKDGDEVGVIQTNLGRIVVQFFPDKAPGHVKNFKDLARKKFYDGTKFHRVIPDFMIQGGDPNSREADRSLHGTGGPGYAIKAEFNDIKHVRGVLSMARSRDPDSAGSQFFIMVAAYPSLDGEYSAFGSVVEGMDVVDKIVALPRDGNDNPLAENPAIIESIRIETWPLK